MNNVDIFFKYKNVDYKLPVLPGSLQIIIPGGNQSTETIKLGEITILRQRKLKSFSVQSIFPGFNNQSFTRTKDDFKRPEYYIELFEGVMEAKEPMRFILTGIKMKPLWVSIEGFDYQYNAGDCDVTYTLSLKEYRPFGQSGKPLEKVSTITNDSDVEVYEVNVSKRVKNGFAIGDKVIVNGAYYRDPYGGIPFVKRPLSFMTASPTDIAGSIYKNLRDRPVELVNADCVIVQVESNANKVRRNDVLDKVDIIPIFAPFKVADSSRKALGWVPATSLIHKP